MKCFKRATAVLTVGLMMLCLSSCGSKNPEEDTSPSATAAPSVTMATIYRQNLADMISAQEISDALGVEMNDPTVSQQGTVLTSLAPESRAVLTVEVQQRPKEIFDRALQSYFDLVPCPNLGDTAWYSPLYYQLMVYGKGTMMLVEITGIEDKDYEVTMLRARQIAALLLERMPQETE